MNDTSANNDQEHLWVSWDVYHQAIEQLAKQVHASGWEFDHILCLARGGLRPGDVFSRLFKRPLAILSTSSYREDYGMQRGTLDIAPHITTTHHPIQGRVLLMDDLVDSGITLQQVQQYLIAHYPAITELKTALIWFKSSSVITPDYYHQYLENHTWIHQPFEAYDALTPDLIIDNKSN
jgi:hypoxanthine phosphoribosyltransferase